MSPNKPISVLEPVAVSVLRSVDTEHGRFLVEHPDSFAARVRAKNDIAALFGYERRATPLFDAARYSLASSQTPIRNQGDRGSGYAFAAVAAVEATYKRRFGLDLDLSEEYAFHLNKAGELYSDHLVTASPHENNSSLWGFQGASDIIGKLVRSRLPLETAAPYRSQSELVAIAGDLGWDATQEQLDVPEFAEAHIPMWARLNCRFGPVSWATLADRSPGGLEAVLREGHEIVADVDVKWRYDAARDALDYDPASPGGGHVFLVVGYDRAAGVFEVKNSWGEDRLIRVTYEFMRQCCLGGSYVLEVADPNDAPQAHAMWLGDWTMDHDGWRGTVRIRRHTDYRNPDPTGPTKLGTYYPAGGGQRDVNGYFLDGGRHIVFHIAGTDEKVAPGSLNGQRFDGYLFSWDQTCAAGTTTWGGIPFGLVLRRDAIGGTPAGDFGRERWLGDWAMNHDGWRGRFRVDSIVSLPLLGDVVTGTYAPEGAAAVAVTGLLDADHPHVLRLTISFPGGDQPFVLHHHTWERGVFAGTTEWAGQTFGVQGFQDA